MTSESVDQKMNKEKIFNLSKKKEKRGKTTTIKITTNRTHNTQWQK